MRQFILGGALILTCLTLAGCETTKGIGRDITRAAEAVDRRL
ncbi:MAG: entericidin, EcnA/B family [Pseudomonadota bacterium]